MNKQSLITAVLLVMGIAMEVAGFFAPFDYPALRLVIKVVTAPGILIIICALGRILSAAFPDLSKKPAFPFWGDRAAEHATDKSQK